MRRAAKVTFPAALLIFSLAGCSKPSAPEAHWAAEASGATHGMRATFRLSTLSARVGARLDAELVATAPAGTPVELEPFHPPGLEPVDATALPVELDPSGNEVRQWRWTFQAGPPGPVTNPPLELWIRSGNTTQTLAIKLPVLVIHSAFAPGTFTNALPSLEGTNAF